MNGNEYVTHLDSWEENATVRSRPRRVLDDDGLGYYPVDRQPLCSHPIISQLGPRKLEYVLLQSLYKYLNDIIIFETEVVNKTAREIAKGVFPFDFPFAFRHDAMSVVVDEDYHAFVAMDYVEQVTHRTGVARLELPTQIELSLAIPAALAVTERRFRPGVELLAVAISENTVTSDVAAFARDKSIKRSVKGVMTDHLADEGRHSTFWRELVRFYWSSISEEERAHVGAALPLFLKTYLVNDLQCEFDRRLIAALDLEPKVAQQISEDLVNRFPITVKHPMIANIRKFLEQSQVLDHQPTRLALTQIIG